MGLTWDVVVVGYTTLSTTWQPQEWLQSLACLTPQVLAGLLLALTLALLVNPIRNTIANQDQ